MREEWNDKEMILTLYIYLTHKSEDLNKTSNFLIDFCNRLNKYTGNNRSVASIGMRISNYKSVDPSYNKIGLSNGGKRVLEFWNRYHDNFELMEEMYTDFVNSTFKVVSSQEFQEFEKLTHEYKSLNGIEDKDAFVNAMYNIRNGSIQRVFRDNLFIEFNQKCALCGVNRRELLKSSHILPYSKCKNKWDMANHNNGLLLCANHDALFDKRLISFEEDGRIIISKKVEKFLYQDLNINQDLTLDKKYLNDERLKFLKLHRNLMK